MTDETSDKLLFSVDDHIATITINRPAIRNAFDPETLCRMADAFETCKTDDQIRAVIVTGTGEQAFCSGADLGRFVPLMTGARVPENAWDSRLLSDRATLERGLLRDFDIEKPVIAAINGDAIAGGMEMLQGTDLRIAADHARFALQEVKWGLFPVAGSTVRLPRQIPYVHAMEILLTGDKVGAGTMFELGFLNRVVPAAALMATALELARKIVANGPLAVRAIRRSVRECLGRPEAEALALERQLGDPVFASEDAREGPKSFLERRPAHFNGR